MDRDVDGIERVVSYVTLTSAAVGVTVNVFWVAVMVADVSRKKIAPKSLFLTALAAVDCVILALDAINRLVYFVSESSSDDVMYGSNAWRCRIGSFGNEVSRIVSSWLTVAMVTEASLCAV